MNASRHQRGIIGWVLALMLAGLALAMLTPFVMGQHKRSAEDTERAALEAARTAVVAYAMTHGKLPTPVPDTKDPKRCPNGIMPGDLGVNNWGRYGAANPFCLDTNVTLSGTSNPKALCAAARSELATPNLPYVCNNAADAVDSACAGSRSPVAFVIYSTGNDRGGNRKHDLLLNPSLNTTLGHVYEHDFRGIDDSPGTNHYDDQILSYPLASLLAECGKLGGAGGAPVCRLDPPSASTTPVVLTASVTNMPNSCADCVWTPSGAGLSGLGGSVTPLVDTTYTVAATNPFGSCSASSTVTVSTPCATPACTPSASPTPITSGNPSTLSANCSVTPAAPLTYLWNNGCTGATCPVSPSTSTTYSVTATSGACSSVPAATTVTVDAAPAVYVVQDGKTYTPNTIGAATWGNDGTADWSTANAFCLAATFNGYSDWQLPQSSQLKSLATSGALNGQGWVLAKTWSSTASSTTAISIDMKDGTEARFSKSDLFYVSCFRYLPYIVASF